MTPLGGLSFMLNIAIVIVAYTVRPFPRLLTHVRTASEYVFSNTIVSLVTSLLIAMGVLGVIMFYAIAYVSLTLEPAHASALVVFLSQNADVFALYITDEIPPGFQDLSRIVAHLGGRVQTFSK